ncbi:MAG: hypothetical protein WD733_00080 [Bryobacterales bacterium]
MYKRRLLWFWTAPLVLTVLLGGCNQPTESEADGDEATADSPAASKASPAGGSAAREDRAAAPPPAPRQTVLPAGTALTVRTTNSLSTKSVQTGETFTTSLEEAIVDGSRVVAEKGATVYGKVVNADPGGRVKGVASLTVRLTELQTADGDRVAINTDTYGVEAKTTKKKDAVKVGIASGIGAAIGAIAGGGGGAAKGAGIGAGAGAGAVLATKGDPAVIPSETVITFSLSEPVTIP